MNSSLLLRNKIERRYKKEIRLIQNFDSKKTRHNKSLNRDIIELKLNIPLIKEENRKSTPKYHSLFRHKLTKSSSSTINLSSICSQNISYSVSPINKENKFIVNDTNFLQFKNASLIRNYTVDELVNKIQNRCNTIFDTSTIKLLDSYFNQLQQCRQSETYYLFTKFNSSLRTYNVDDWKQIVLINYQLTHCLIQIIEALLIQFSKEKKNSQHPLIKLPKISHSHTPVDRKSGLKQIDNLKEETIRDLKHKIKLQEGKHQLNMYYLEEEIKELTFLLEKQKDYTQGNREKESQIKIKNDEILQLKRESRKRIDELENEIISTRDQNSLISESMTKIKQANELLTKKINEFEQMQLNQNILIHKFTREIQENQRSIQVLLKEKEYLIDELKSVKDTYNNVLLLNQELE